MVALANRIDIVVRGFFDREQNRRCSELPEIWSLLDRVCDPEIPVLSLWDIGVLTDVRQQLGEIIITITPTYSGCPALETMRNDIITLMQAAGYDRVRVESKLAPAWTTDWMSPEGKQKLKAYGIAPPQSSCASGETPESGVECPHCGSHETRRISEFGSTACKALFSCKKCREAFDFFKNI